MVKGDRLDGGSPVASGSRVIKYGVLPALVHSGYLWQVADLTQASRVASVRHPSFTIS